MGVFNNDDGSVTTNAAPVASQINTGWGSHGWTCPRCGSIWAPTTPGCFKCNAGSKQVADAASTTSGKDHPHVTP